ncbi:hypothetical protein E2C01_078078 [Portunus trituberculatus]|uniref:Uncharacterized protein n=1 Tax=Portunus trituberculatus TaxID=210409 RepID=A0A5B7IMX5_PORTR|nr:hypothetical protein [Portunus trituberculatus]
MWLNVESYTYAQLKPTAKEPKPAYSRIISPVKKFRILDDQRDSGLFDEIEYSCIIMLLTMDDDEEDEGS